MLSARVKIILASLLLAQLSFSCTSGRNTNTNGGPGNTAPSNTSVARDKPEELALVIVFPIEPEEAVWREDAVNTTAPDNSHYTKKLTAVLKYPPLEAGKLATLIANAGPATPAAVDAETWFPAELIAQSEMSGDDLLKGDSYPARDFFQAPYNDGKITRIDGTDYFVLELLAK